MSDLAALLPGGFMPRGCRQEPAFRWFVVSTAFHGEGMVERCIRRRGMATWLPQFRTPKKQLGLLFPRYVFMQADLTDNRWQGVYTERGVDTVLGTRGEKPQPVPVGVLEMLWRDCLPSGVVRDGPAPLPAGLAPIATGASVRVASGKLVGWAGVCRWSTAKRVGALLSIMGRDVPVEMPREHVEAA